MKNNIQKLNLFNTHVQRTYRVAGLFYVLLKYYLIPITAPQAKHSCCAHFYFQAHFTYGKTEAESVEQLPQSCSGRIQNFNSCITSSESADLTLVLC